MTLDAGESERMTRINLQDLDNKMNRFVPLRLKEKKTILKSELKKMVSLTFLKTDG